MQTGDPYLQAQASKQLAQAFLQTRDLVQAVAYFKQTLALDFEGPSDMITHTLKAELFVGLAIALKKQGNTAEAVGCCAGCWLRVIAHGCRFLTFALRLRWSRHTARSQGKMAALQHR